MNMTRYDTSRSLTRHVPIYVSPSVVENHGPVNSTKLFISRSEMVEKGSTLTPLIILAELESKIWKFNQIQPQAKIVWSNLKMTAPAQHAQLVIPIFLKLSITKRTLICMFDRKFY